RPRDRPLRPRSGLRHFQAFRPDAIARSNRHRARLGRLTGAARITEWELADLLKTLARDQHVNLGVGDADRRGWFRAQVISHDAASGRLVLTYAMDRPFDRPLEPGEAV